MGTYNVYSLAEKEWAKTAFGNFKEDLLIFIKCS